MSGEYPSNNQPYAIRQQYNKVVSLANPYATDTSEFAGGVSPYPYYFDPKNPRFTRPAGLVAMDANYKWPYSYQINFGVQQQFGRSTALSLSYVASLSRKLPLFFDHNYPVYNAANPARKHHLQRRQPQTASTRRIGKRPNPQDRLRHRVRPDLQLQRVAGHARSAHDKKHQLPRFLHLVKDHLECIHGEQHSPERL